MKSKSRATRAPRTPQQWAGMVLVAVVALWLLGVGVWYERNLFPVSAGTQSQLVIIESGSSVDQIAKQLVDDHLIRSASAFTLYLSLHGLRPRLQSGAYELRPNQSTRDIIKTITAGRVAQQKMTVPEGFTVRAIRARAATFGIAPTDFDAALNQDLAGTQAAKRPSGISLEGYLFPDTYIVTPATTAQQLVRSMIDHFDKKVTPQIVQGFAAQGLSLHQGLTLASIVEREVSTPADQKLVAGVFLNRLRAGQKLESDVTVDYGRALLGKPFSTALNSPYNTYQIAGLPVGPICNPGLNAMNAVINPTTSDYFYFVAGKDGKTHYAKTIDEHNANVQKYLR